MIISRFRSFKPVSGAICRRGLASDGSSNLVELELVENGSIGILKFNDPSRLNALTESMGESLKEKVEELKLVGTGVRAAILTGNGRAFSAGGDLNWLMDRHRDTPENNKDIMMKFYSRYLTVLRSTPWPIIAAINGPAIGAGMCVAAGGCDIRIAGPKAKMGFTFVGLGLHPGMGATHFVPKILGPSMAAELMLTGRVISAEEALRIGFVSSIKDDPVASAIDLAKEISKGAPMAVSTCLETLRMGVDKPMTFEESLRREAEGQALTYPTQDLAEGIAALQEKRPPNFKGN